VDGWVAQERSKISAAAIPGSKGQFGDDAVLSGVLANSTCSLSAVGGEMKCSHECAKPSAASRAVT